MTEYVTQNIRTVLKTFQHSAPKSLQGPGHSLQAASQTLDAANAGGDLAPSAANNTHSHSPCSAAGEHCHLGGAAAGAAAAANTVPPPVALIKKEIFSSPEPYDLNESPSITIVPPPPPELPQPILSAADSGSGELYETRLEGKTIGCYSLGGEMRLCLPQFLNNVLADFTLDQINRIFDELGIFCSQCTPDQLMEFKAAKILPSDVKACGLITRTDAERLCAALLHRSDRNIYISDAEIPKGAISFKVYHRCFGKCEGICTPDMYSYAKPTCIMCLECKGYFSPQKFVGHVHRKQENRTCHWGFDSRNWHEYLHVALDVENRDKYQKILDELKEVEFKEAMKAQRDMSYLKRKAEMFLDDAMLSSALGQAVILPPHQQLVASAGKQPRELLDIPTKKVKSLDEAATYQLSEYQRYQALFYAQCVQQQQRIGQMSAFRPWAPPKTFLQMPYSGVAPNLPYLSQEPPVLQNPERVVRSTDRERFERTYQPNVALAPRKSILTKEREKEHRERERDRERERERDLRERERFEREQQQRERELERVRERERSLERERGREQRERERELQQQKLQQQQVTITNLCEAELVHIKQERANTPSEVALSTPPADEEALLEPRSNGPLEDEATMPLASPLSLSRSQQQQQKLYHHHHHQQQQQQQLKSNNIDLFQQRRHTLHTSNSASSASSTSSTLSTHSERDQLLLSSTSPLAVSHLPPPSHLHRLQQQQQPLPLSQPHPPHLRQQHHSPPSPCPEEFSGSNEISSSTSPLPPPTPYHQQHPSAPRQQSTNTSSTNCATTTTTNSNNSSNSNHLHLLNQQTIIATVNQHAKLLPANSSCSGAAALAASHGSGLGAGDTPSRIRISKNLLNQSNFLRSPTPPPARQQKHPLQYEQHYKQQQQQTRFYNQQQQQQHQHKHQQLPSQSSSANSSSNGNMSSNALSLEARPAAGLNLSSNGVSVLVAKQRVQQNGGAHGGSEFELSTDTDDDSLNGEPDSSNMLAPWELAVDALKDARPKDRERILQLLQKLLHENQQYRFDNVQLSEELRRRDKQICELQEQLYRRHQQQQQHQHQQQQHQVAVLTTTNQNGERDEEGLLRLPLKKATRREAAATSDATAVVVSKQLQQQHYNSCGYERDKVARAARTAEDTDSDVDDEEAKNGGTAAEEEIKQEPRASASDSDNDEDEGEGDGEGEGEGRKMKTVVNGVETETKKSTQLGYEIDDSNSANAKAERKLQQRHSDDADDENNSCTSDMDSADEGDGVDLQAARSSAAVSPAAGATLMSPDSAATAGRLFDSSSSSDDESMKQAQRSASKALAKMAADRPEASGEEDGDDDDEDDGGRDDDEEDEEQDEDEEDVDADRNEEEEEEDEEDEQKSDAMAAAAATTTTTNHGIQIKQEII